MDYQALLWANKQINKHKKWKLANKQNSYTQNAYELYILMAKFD